MTARTVFERSCGLRVCVCVGALLMLALSTPTAHAAGLEWSTYLGGSGTESAKALAVDSAMNVYIVGSVEEGEFPTLPGAYDETFNGQRNAFVAVFNPSGSALLASTVIGGRRGGLPPVHRTGLRGEHPHRRGDLFP